MFYSLGYLLLTILPLAKARNVRNTGIKKKKKFIRYLNEKLDFILNIIVILGGSNMILQKISK